MIQQTIQEIKFEDIIISKKQRQALKTNKLRHWLEYLNMLDQNHNHIKKNNTIKDLHTKFILNQDFWYRQTTRVLQQKDKWSIQTFQFVFMALEDGFYVRVALLIAQKLVEAYIDQKLRLNFVIAKLQIIIAQFDHRVKQCSNFLDLLIKVYTKANNIKKIRQTYQRQISMGFEDYDVVYVNYIKWQQSQNNPVPQNIVQILQKGKSQWQKTQIFIDTMFAASQKLNSLIVSHQLKNDKKNIKRCIIFLQSLNKSRIDAPIYLEFINLLTLNSQKLWYLRRLALCQTHQFVEEYLQLLQLSNAQDQQIINTFKRSFDWYVDWQNCIKYESLYLSYLIRRINKHLSKPQQQQYNTHWGENVQFFRNQISQLISKQRSTIFDKIQLELKYYFLWINVEVSLVRDSSAVQQIYENLLKQEVPKSLIYIKYAQSMIKLNDIAKARWIFNKTCQAQNYQGNIVQSYQKFLQIYGTLQEICKLKQKLNNKQKPKPIVLKQIPKIASTIVSEQQNISKVKSSQKQDQQKSVITKNQSQRLDNSPKSEKSSENQNKKQQKPKNEDLSFKRSSPAQQLNGTNNENGNHIQKKKVHLDNQNTLFSKNIQKDWTQADIMLNIQFKEYVNQIRIVQKQHSRFCYIEFDSEETAQKELNKNKSALYLAFSKPPAKSDNCTLFLCNLPLDIAKNKIMDLVPKNYQQLIKQIRTKQKGDKKTAYIQFNDEETRNEVLSILKKQKIKIDNKAIIALSCQGEFKNKDKKHKTIFLKNLSFKCKQKDIKKFFEQKGFNSLIEAYIPKDEKTNRPKGYAYVEFTDNDQVQKAVQLQSGSLFTRQFTISRSDRAITHQQQHYEQKKHYQKTQKTQMQKKKSQTQNGKSNNFFSNIFS